jgi:hypothetical protein
VDGENGRGLGLPGLGRSMRSKGAAVIRTSAVSSTFGPLKLVTLVQSLGPGGTVLLNPNWGLRRRSVLISVKREEPKETF